MSDPLVSQPDVPVAQRSVECLSTDSAVMFKSETRMAYLRVLLSSVDGEWGQSATAS